MRMVGVFAEGPRSDASERLDACRFSELSFYTHPIPTLPAGAVPTLGCLDPEDICDSCVHGYWMDNGWRHWRVVNCEPHAGFPNLLYQEKTHPKTLITEASGGV